jgi:hypothetical protein
MCKIINLIDYYLIIELFIGVIVNDKHNGFALIT